jgi:hypothetical protein
MKSTIQNLIRIVNRTGYCERVMGVAGTDYDFVEVALSGSRVLPYEQRHSHVLTVTIHRRFQADCKREFWNIELNGDLIHDTDVVVGLVNEACADAGVMIAQLH